MKKYINYENLFIGSIFSIITILFCLLSSNTFLKYDDFCFRAGMRNENYISMLWNHYITWDGRAISPLYLLRNLFVNFLTPEINSVLATVALIGVSYQMVCLVLTLSNSLQNSKFNKLLLTILISACIWLSLRANLSRIIYWPIGSFYIYVALVLFMSIYLLIAGQNKFGFIALSVLTIFGGLNVAFSFLCLYFYYVYFYISSKGKKYSLASVIFIISFLVMALSPGNFARASTFKSSSYAFDFIQIIMNYFIILKEYILMSKWLLAMSIVSGFLFVFFLEKKYINKKYILFHSFLMMSCGLLTIVPFVLLPEAASRHTSLFFQLFIFLSLILLFIYLFINLFGYNQNKLFIVSTFIVILFSYEAIQQYRLSFKLKNRIAERIIFIKNNMNLKEIEIEYLQSDRKIYTHFYKDHREQNWIYECMSNYYNCGMIKLKK